MQFPISGSGFTRGREGWEREREREMVRSQVKIIPTITEIPKQKSLRKETSKLTHMQTSDKMCLPLILSHAMRNLLYLLLSFFLSYSQFQHQNMTNLGDIFCCFWMSSSLKKCPLHLLALDCQVYSLQRHRQIVSLVYYLSHAMREHYFL